MNTILIEKDELIAEVEFRELSALERMRFVAELPIDPNDAVGEIEVTPELLTFLEDLIIELTDLSRADLHEIPQGDLKRLMNAACHHLAGEDW